MRSFLLAALFSIFASQVLALNISIAGLTGTVDAVGFLSPNDPALAACPGDCTNALNVVQGCNGDDACLCNGTTTLPTILKCEQCMFAQLISDNRLPKDPRAGQTDALTAYAAACSPAHTIPKNVTFVLVPPPGWDGPFGQGLTTFGTVVSVVAAAVLGTGMITVVNVM
ncbi:hypothetical protein BC628DRAFT_1416507 [Trametes gibbosa]|nr:hypothetical protein BC628DRAFT_1416507 [Trametes gibbosa]